MKKAFSFIFALLFAAILVSCSSTGKINETTNSDEKPVTTETTTSEEITTEAITTTEVTTTQCECTDPVTTTSEKVDVTEIETEIQRLWKIKSIDKPNLNVSTKNFLFEKGKIYGGSDTEFRNEYMYCGTYKISEDGKLICTFFSFATGRSSTCVYVPSFDDTGETMNLYCYSSDGLSFFAGSEYDIEYTLTFVLTNFPSESKSHDAKLKGDWYTTDQKSPITLISIMYYDSFRFSSEEGGERKEGTWRGYSGKLTLTYSDGIVKEFDYKIDNSGMKLTLSSEKEFETVFEKMVPLY